MANLAITVNNSINCFGPDETQNWGGSGLWPMSWGVSLWGTRGMTTQKEFYVSLDMLVSSDTSLAKDILHYIDDTFDFTGYVAHEYMQDQQGYYYEFYKPTRDAVDRNNPSYTESTATQPTYTSLTVSSFTWS